MADPSQQAAAAAAAAAYGAASTANAATPSGTPPNPQSSSSSGLPSSGAGDRCAQCQAVGVSLLTPDEPVGMAPAPNSNKPRYVVFREGHLFDVRRLFPFCARVSITYLKLCCDR